MKLRYKIGIGVGIWATVYIVLWVLYGGGPATGICVGVPIAGVFMCASGADHFVPPIGGDDIDDSQE